MDPTRLRALLERYGGWWGGRPLAVAIRLLRALPVVEDRLRRESAGLFDELRATLRPYRGRFDSHPRLPARGRPRQQILDVLEQLAAEERSRWHDGYASGAVYHGDADHVAFLDRAYALSSQANPLHGDLWPSAIKFEAEIVSMTAHLLGGAGTGACGTVTSGGTESILLAVKAYRDRARQERGITRPELIAPTTAHAAFDKACGYLGVTLRRIPVDQGFRADVRAARRALSRRTIALVGSAPSFPHGVIDPIEELCAIARERGIGFHTDACLGGFVLPWAERLGHPVPPFDFRLPGVTSISADTHKYGYAAKGTSVILYRDPALRRYQYYTVADWPGGLYCSPTIAGSRPGALSAACWAAMLAMGEEGYLEATRRILAAAEAIKQGIRQIPALEILGDPLFNIAFRSREVDIYQVLAVMARRGWSLNGLHRPPCVHLCVTLRHAQPGVAERFLSDLAAAVDDARAHPEQTTGMAPIYGMAAALPEPGLVEDLLAMYLDALYEV